MPNKQNMICNHLECPRLAVKNGYCEEHQDMTDSDVQKKFYSEVQKAE